MFLLAFSDFFCFKKGKYFENVVCWICLENATSYLLCKLYVRVVNTTPTTAVATVLYKMPNVGKGHIRTVNVQGPVVQSVVSLTSSLRVISLTVLADSIYNILIFFAEKMWVAFACKTHMFSAKNFSIFAYH